LTTVHASLLAHGHSNEAVVDDEGRTGPRFNEYKVAEKSNNLLENVRTKSFPPNTTATMATISNVETKGPAPERIARAPLRNTLSCNDYTQRESSPPIPIYDHTHTAYERRPEFALRGSRPRSKSPDAIVHTVYRSLE
jgi:hypothetical protein